MPRRAAVNIPPRPVTLRPETLGELPAEAREALGPVHRPVPTILPWGGVLSVPAVVEPVAAATEPLPAIEPVALVLPRRAPRRWGRRGPAVVEPPPVVVQAVAERPLPLHAAAETNPGPRIHREGCGWGCSGEIRKARSSAHGERRARDGHRSSRIRIRCRPSPLVVSSRLRLLPSHSSRSLPATASRSQSTAVAWIWTRVGDFSPGSPR